jgi:hypothetical protein
VHGAAVAAGSWRGGGLKIEVKKSSRFRDEVLENQEEEERRRKNRSRGVCVEEVQNRLRVLVLQFKQKKVSQGAAWGLAAAAHEELQRLRHS